MDSDHVCESCFSYQVHPERREDVASDLFRIELRLKIIRGVMVYVDISLETAKQRSVHGEIDEFFSDFFLLSQRAVKFSWTE